MKDYSDFNKYDKLTVDISNAVAEDILPCYKSLGWELSSRIYKKNKSSYCFYRKHSIANKDRLQLLQVYMENTVNQLSAYAKREHIKSITLFASATFLSFLIIVAGILLATQKNLVAYGIVIGVLGLIIHCLLALLAKKLYLKEEKKFAKIKEHAIFEINKVNGEALALIGGEDEQV